MTADEFVAIIRKGSDKLRVDDIVLDTGETQFHGKGMLRVQDEQIEIQITLAAGETLPDVPTGVFTKRDCWRLEGIIEDLLHFRCNNVGPVPRSESWWPNGITRCTLRIHPIDLVPSGWQAMSREERDDFTRNSQPQPELSDGLNTLQTPKAESEMDASFYAVIFNYPLFSHDSKGKFAIETEHFKVLLRKDEETGDLHVSMDSKTGYVSTGESEDWQRFRAFMNSLAFVYGIHAWPYRIEYWKAGRKLTDRVTAVHKLTKTSHSPFTETLAFNAKTGALKWDLQEPLQKANSFFITDTILSKEISELLFLFREADDSHSGITIIALCTLFENLIRLLFKELDVETTSLNLELQKFEQAKKKVADELSQQEGTGARRLHNVVRSAHLLSTEQLFQAVTNYFGLKWEKDMETIFHTWRNARNPLIHAKSRADQSEDELKESLLNESRIAGSINILLLKLFKYSGLMRWSTFEDKYRQV